MSILQVKAQTRNLLASSSRLKTIYVGQGKQVMCTELHTKQLMGSQVMSSSLIILLLLFAVGGATLDVDYYHETCPQVEDIVFQAVQKAAENDLRVPPRLLRMFFHDCFVRGCDGSVLLDSTPTNRAEKDGIPNISLAAFYVIDNAKKILEESCPGIVSCADILAVAARDAVVLSGGPNWGVLKGRKDGRISIENESRTLPPPSFNTSELIQSFAQRGLSVKDLVALSGGHTLGFSHCSSFETRIKYGDPTLDPTFVADLKQKCPVNNSDHDAGQFLDLTASVFDNQYYLGMVAGRGLLTSDETLYGDPRTRSTVEAFARDEALFFREFAAAMVRMGNIRGDESGEVRMNCRVVN